MIHLEELGIAGFIEVGGGRTFRGLSCVRMVQWTLLWIKDLNFDLSTKCPIL